MKNIKIHKGENLQENDFRGVYLIRNLDNNLLKIGRCNNLSRRFKEISKSFRFCGASPNLKIECFLEYSNEIDLELFLHEQFDDVREQNEWFKINDINIILDKLNVFKDRKLKEKKEENIKKKKSNEVQKPKPIKVDDEYHYFEFFNSYSRKGIYHNIIWRSKIFDIGILTKKISNITDEWNDPYQIFMFYEGDICKHEIKPSKSVLKAFEEKNTDCIVEVCKTIKYEEEVVYEDGEVEIVEHSKKVSSEIFDYCKYLHNGMVECLYNSIYYCKETIGVKDNKTLEEIKELCQLLGYDILEYLGEENKKFSKMLKVFENPDITVGGYC